MSIHPSRKWHTKEPPLFPHGATRTCLQTMKEDSCAKCSRSSRQWNPVLAPHDAARRFLWCCLFHQWSLGKLSSHLCRSQICLLQGDNRCQPLRRRLGQRRTPAVTSIKATHHLHVTGKVHLALPTAPGGEISPPEKPWEQLPCSYKTKLLAKSIHDSETFKLNEMV